MSTRRRRSGIGTGWGVPHVDTEGRPVCRWCRQPVRPPRRTFCSERCVHEWRIRTDPAFLREAVWIRDRGICQRCLVDLAEAERQWRKRKPPTRSVRLTRAWLQARPRWEVDHIVPVADGGGECGLANLRLLCRPCHVAVTRAWRIRAKSVRDPDLTRRPD